jgi:hypothetical protein
VRRILGAVPQIFDTAKSVALWSAKKKKRKKRTIKGYGSAATYNHKISSVNTLLLLKDSDCRVQKKNANKKKTKTKTKNKKQEKKQKTNPPPQEPGELIRRSIVLTDNHL